MSATDAPRIAIVGAGFSGIGMAHTLKQNGFTNVRIFERAADAGGVWHHNTYPGAACDIPSRLYSFSFAPKPDWSQRYAVQAEIKRYLHDCIQRFDLQSQIHYQHEVLRAEWNEQQQWTLHFNDQESYTADILIIACGILSKPQWPSIQGINEFTGQKIHTALWPKEFNADNKRVAVIGTGATAIQVIPELAKQAKQLVVFQRSAPHVLLKFDWAYSSISKALLKAIPFFNRVTYRSLHTWYELRGFAFHSMDWSLSIYHYWVELIRWLQVRDKTLRDKLKPTEPLGCKRVLISNNYYPALQRANVILEADSITRLTSNAIETKSGKNHAVDAIVFATGFTTSPYFSQFELIGRGGQSLQQAWEKETSAYLGISAHGFPNAFFIYGPNTNLSHNSIPYMLESQFPFILQAVQHYVSNKKPVEVKAEAQHRFDQKTQNRLKDLVWQQCQSWYLDENGRNTHNWPGSTWSYRRAARVFDVSDFV
jgi:cation diffusion facilitator CzcD-associated flavoprotein CzcO